MDIEAPTRRPVVVFRKALLSSPGPLRADASALGTLPTAAFQYCEAIRTASSFGWYIFPPCDIRALWDGTQILLARNGEWCPLDAVPYDIVNDIDPTFIDYWGKFAPHDMKKKWPSLVTGLFNPGILQIWSGLLVTTAKGWGLSVGPTCNLRSSSDYVPYEAIVEANNCRPLFINVQLITTGREIFISKSRPLFQVKPVHESCFSDETMRCEELDGIVPIGDAETGMKEADWDGYRASVSLLYEPEAFSPGRYAVERRKNRKRSRHKEVR
jgi:hypothetical protein